MIPLDNGILRAIRLSVVLFAAAGTTVRPSAAADAPAPAPFTSVGVEQFEAMSKKEGVVVLDVRTPGEYKASHIEGAVLIDWQAPDFAERIRKLEKGKTYLVHCAIGGRSVRASKALAELEIGPVYNLKGGIRAWERAGKPTKKGE